MGDAPQTASRLERILGLVILLLLLAGSLLVMLPFLSALAWAFVMAFSLWPAYRLLVVSLNQRKTLAAMIMTSAIALVLVVPTVVTVVNLSDDARAIATSARRWLTEGKTASPHWVTEVPLVGTRAAAYWDTLAQQAAQLLQSTSEATDERSVAATTAPATTQAAQQQPVPDTSLSRV